MDPRRTAVEGTPEGLSGTVGQMRVHTVATWTQDVTAKALSI
jgi:hypothetical protein